MKKMLRKTTLKGGAHTYFALAAKCSCANYCMTSNPQQTQVRDYTTMTQLA